MSKATNPDRNGNTFRIGDGASLRLYTRLPRIHDPKGKLQNNTPSERYSYPGERAKQR